MKAILWGGATSASQYEGGFVDGKGIDTQDCRPYFPRTSNATTQTRLLTEDIIKEAKDQNSGNFYPFRKGSAGYEHRDEDIELIKELGLDLYRFSLSWSRLFPNGDEKNPNEAGITYYDRIFKKLKAANIKIFLTMNHYAVPLYLVEKYGGWTNPKMIDFYLNFAEFVLKRWGDYVDYWLPFNEINAGFFSPYNGVGLIKPNNNEYNYQDVFQSLHHQFVASAKTIRLARKLNVKGTFGAMISCFSYYPYSARPEDNLKLVTEEQVNQWFCLDVLAKGKYPYYMDTFFKKNDVQLEISDEDRELLANYTCDFVSFSYYTSNIITTEEGEKTAGNLVVSTKNPYLDASEWGWQIDPIGMQTTLHKVYDRYQKPVIVSENGFGAQDTLKADKVADPYRIKYFDEHFKQIIKAHQDGVPVVAYIAWGIIDIVSAGSCEMGKRYGVIYVDADNQGNGDYKRYKKASFSWYQDFIKSYHQNFKKVNSENINILN
ncbi:MAG: glycoside hydrolase family 1 protein [Micrococcaceae bacterium]